MSQIDELFGVAYCDLLVPKLCSECDLRGVSKPGFRTGTARPGRVNQFQNWGRFGSGCPFLSPSQFFAFGLRLFAFAIMSEREMDKNSQKQLKNIRNCHRGRKRRILKRFQG